MKGAWKEVSLGDVLKRSGETISPQGDASYQEITVRLWGKGVLPRGTVTGTGMVAQRRFVARAGQFILSRIDARNGALGIVPTELDGALVSNDFPLYSVACDQLLPAYLGWLCRTRSFVEKCQLASEGTTNRVRLQEDRFLRTKLSLPPYCEQQRIVAMIDTLASEIAKAQMLRQQAEGEANELMGAVERAIWPASTLQGAPTLEAVTTLLARGRQSEQGESSHYLIKTQHVQQGLYVPTKLRLAPHVAAKVTPEAVVRNGDILIACSAAGCLGRVARYLDDGKVASTDTHVAVARADAVAVLPDYLYAYLRGAQGQYQLRSRERGDWKREKISFRLTELNLSDLKKVPVPIPSRTEQLRIIAELNELHGEVESVRRSQASTAQEIDALLPSLLSHTFDERC
jgi:type I restriction enzyme, S subunit